MPTSLDQTASNAPDASNVRWQFIDSSNNSRTNLTQVKRHVMQEYMRQKKGGTRQSESEEEAPRPKRGRTKKTRGAQRKSKKTKSDGDNNHNQPRARRSTRKQSTRKEDLNLDVNCDVFVSNPISSDPPLIESNDVPSFSPFRPSSAESQGVPLPLDGFVDVHPQSSPSHDLDFNNFSWPSPSTVPYQFMPSPTTMISGAQIDTLNTLPLPMNLGRDGYRVFDSYVNDIPASYGPHYRSPMAHNGYTPAFVPGTMKGTIAFQNTIFIHGS